MFTDKLIITLQAYYIKLFKDKKYAHTNVDNYVDRFIYTISTLLLLILFKIKNYSIIIVFVEYV